ncbi:vanadium-dependent haloperoxidase [Aquirufa sp. ROCK-SH2]
MKKIIAFIFLFFTLISCNQKEGRDLEIAGTEIDKVVLQMTEMMIHDVSNPPLAMRFFSYASLAAYDLQSDFDSTLPRIQDRLSDFPKIIKPDPKDANISLAALMAMMDVSAAMQPSGLKMKDWKKNYIDSCGRSGFSSHVLEASQELANHYSSQILKYAKADKYNQISRFLRYSPEKKPGFWYPTPPGYFPAVEPYFSRIRSFHLKDSSLVQSLCQIEPVKYSDDKSSQFYQMTKEVLESGKSESQQKIAAFWDCNPFALSENGHLLIAMKKISPGAHWMGIAGIACKMKKMPFGKSLLVRTALSVSLMDAFWICWKRKYETNRIRPETAIRQLIDPTWKPFLQTPPFPEYPSGHSTISTTAAIILSHFFGENFAYVDTVEMRYGIDERPFKSFKLAAEEAAISRLYGGIHFMDGITAGQQQGKLLGEYLVKNWLK